MARLIAELPKVGSPEYYERVYKPEKASIERSVHSYLTSYPKEHPEVTFILQTVLTTGELNSILKKLIIMGLHFKWSLNMYNRPDGQNQYKVTFSRR